MTQKPRYIKNPQASSNLSFKRSRGYNILASAVILALFSTQVPLANAHESSTTAAKLCSKQMSGSAVLSNREYSSGDFEFRMKPSMSAGIRTVVGLANDGVQHSDPFIQMVFDSYQFGSGSFAVHIGGVTDLFGEGQSNNYFAVNVSENLNSSQPLNLSETELSYKITRVSGNDPHFDFSIASLDDAATFIQVFSTQNMLVVGDLSNFLTNFPPRFNIHAATWYSLHEDTNATMNEHAHMTTSYPVYSSQISHFKYTNSDGSVEEENYFESESLELFTSHTMSSLPTWTYTAGNEQSQIQASMVQYIQKSDSQEGAIVLNAKEGLLPINKQSWYLQYDHDGESLEITMSSSASDDIQATVPLGHMAEDQGQMLLVALDSTPTSTVYTLQLCGSFNAPSNSDLKSWPVKAYLIQINKEPYNEISGVASFNITNSYSCQEVTMEVSIDEGTQMKSNMQDYAALVIDFTPILNDKEVTIPTDTYANFTKLQLTTTCIDESAFEFPGSDVDTQPPTPIIENRYVDKDVVVDEDEKGTYRASVTVWAIFMIILMLLTAFVFYLFKKNRSLLALESQDLQKLEQKVSERRSDLGEHQLLLEKRSGASHRNPVNQAAGPTQDHKQFDRAPQEDQEDDLMAIYDIDGTIKRYQSKQGNSELRQTSFNHQQQQQNDMNVTGNTQAAHVNRSGIDISSIKLEGVNYSENHQYSNQKSDQDEYSSKHLYQRSAEKQHSRHPESDHENDDGVKSERRSIKHESEESEVSGKEKKSSENQSPDIQHHNDSLLDKQPEQSANKEQEAEEEYEYEEY